MKKSSAETFNDKLFKKVEAFLPFFTLLVFIEECKVRPAEIFEFIKKRRDKTDEHKK